MSHTNVPFVARSMIKLAEQLSLCDGESMLAIILKYMSVVRCICMGPEYLKHM